MIISVDARPLSENLTGIGRYLNETLKIMVDSNDFQWILYSHAPIIIGEWDRPNIKIISSNYKTRFMRMIWAQFILPFKLILFKSDIFWSPSHRLPLISFVRIKYFLTIHDVVCFREPFTMKFFSMLLDWILIPLSILKSDRIFTVSDFTKFELCNIFRLKPSKITVTPLGSSFLKSSSSSNFSFEHEFILFVGTCEPRKNLENLINAYSLLDVKTRNKYKLVIAGGSGWGNIDPCFLSKKFGVSDDVICLGYVSDEFLIYLYQKCLFLAFPSLYEGFGLPIIEALSFNKPVLTSNVSSLPEVAGSSAYYIDPINIYSIYNGLRKLIDNKSLRDYLSIQSNNRLAFFNWINCTNIMLNSFKNI